MNKWQCWLEAVWNTLKIGQRTSGHNWVDIEEHKNCTVTVSKCEVCGKIDISWIKNY
jgi:hypothetical protein